LFARKKKIDDFQSAAPKKKKEVQKPKETGPLHTALNHQMETLNYFDQIKTSPPMHTNRLVDTIAQLKEKKAYYQKLSEQAEKGDKTEFKDESKTETKKQSPKKRK